MPPQRTTPGPAQFVRGAIRMGVEMAEGVYPAVLYACNLARVLVGVEVPTNDGHSVMSNGRYPGEQVGHLPDVVMTQQAKMYGKNGQWTTRRGNHRAQSQAAHKRIIACPQLLALWPGQRKPAEYGYTFLKTNSRFIPVCPRVDVSHSQTPG